MVFWGVKLQFTRQIFMFLILKRCLSIYFIQLLNYIVIQKLLIKLSKQLTSNII